MTEDLTTKTVRGIYNWATGTLDFREDDIVVRLGAAPGEGEEYIYVGRDGNGEIRTVETDKLQDAITHNRGTFLNIRDLSDTGIRGFSENVAGEAASLILNNNEGMRPDQVYNIVGDSGDAKSIAELRPLLQGTLANFHTGNTPIGRGEIPDEADGGFEAAYQAEADAYYAINTTLRNMDISDRLPGYRENLLEQAVSEMGELARDQIEGQILNPSNADGDALRFER